MPGPLLGPAVDPQIAKYFRKDWGKGYLWEAGKQQPMWRDHGSSFSVDELGEVQGQEGPGEEPEKPKAPQRKCPHTDFHFPHHPPSWSKEMQLVSWGCG